MPNYKSRKGDIILGTFTDDSALSTKTFTVSCNMLTQYRRLRLLISGTLSAAANLQATINGASDYDYSKQLDDTTTQSTSVSTTNLTIELMPSTIYDLADNYFQAELILRAATTNGGTTVITYTAKSGQSQEGQANYEGNCATAITTITAVLFRVSTGAFRNNLKAILIGEPY